MRTTTRFKQLIQAPELLAMPGVHDALSARLAEEAGFQAVTMGGFAATGALIAEPDSSQLGLMELADHYARIAEAVSIPLFADADTGFGNVTNVGRTVRAYERAGVAGLFIEDQVFPKRCGHTPGKAVVSREEIAGKIKAALDSRHDPDLVIMARTDALAVLGIEEAIARAQLYRELGADLIFVEAPRSVEEMRRIIAEVGGPHLANMVDFGASPDLSATELQEIGFAAAVWPVANVFAVVKALRALYGTLRREGTLRGASDLMVSFQDYMELVGLKALRDREQHYLDAAAEAAAPARRRSA